MPELSIIIIHHRTPGFLKMCLANAASGFQLPASGFWLPASGKQEYELVVVDSMSTRESRDIVRERTPQAKYLSFKYNLGFAKGVNIGIRNSNGKYILILNPDVVVTGDAIQKLLEFIRTHPDVGMVGPQLRNFNTTLQKSYFSYYRPLTIIARRSFASGFGPFRRALDDFLMAGTDSNQIQTPDWLIGSAMMVRRSAIDKVGLMDERFFMYFEDVDWARRFWHNGYKVIYNPHAVMYHYHQRESKSRLGMLDALFNQKTRWHIKSAIKFFWKYRNLQKAAS